MIVLTKMGDSILENLYLFIQIHLTQIIRGVFPESCVLVLAPITKIP